MIDKASLLTVFQVPKPVPVQLPDTDQVVYVRAMNVAQRSQFETLMTKNKELTREALIVMTVCDEDGTLVFSVEDIPSVSELNGALVERLLAKSLELNKFGVEDVDAAEKK